MRRVLLISGRVMHYRVSVYNYFWTRFREADWDFVVRSNDLQDESRQQTEFDFQEVPFRFRDYRREIERLRPDVVVVSLLLKDWILWPLVHWLRWRRIPVLFWTKGLNLDRPGDRLSRALYGYLHRRCDGLILYSRHEIQFVDRKFRHKVTVANNTLNFTAFPNVAETKEQIKAEFGIPFRRVVLSVGRMGAMGGRKKIGHLVDIFNALERRDFGLVIVGSGVGEEVRRRMGESTMYLGEVHDPANSRISKLFKMADVFCIPGHVGLGLNQAFFWGLPVVTEAGRQPPEIHYLVDGRNGFIVGEDDVAGLKAKILYLLEEDDVRATMSRNAREDILREASIENMFEAFRSAVEKATPRDRSGPAGGGT